MFSDDGDRVTYDSSDSITMQVITFVSADDAYLYYSISNSHTAIL